MTRSPVRVSPVVTNDLTQVKVGDDKGGRKHYFPRSSDSTRVTDTRVDEGK